MLFIFDMGGVVTNTAFYINDICENLNISEENFYDYIKNKKDPENDLFSMLTTGKISTNEFWKEFQKKSQKVIETDYFYAMFHPVVNEDVKNIILDLKRKNRVVCGTNTIESHYLNHMQNGDYSIFNQTYASNKMGVKKPDIKFWEIILKAEKSVASNTFFIDDKKENCEAANKIGIKTFNYKNSEELYQEIKEWI
jgi:glucose-1-phosphatase